MVRRISLGTLITVACTGLALAGAGGPNWAKWGDAKKLAAATGKPIAVYSVTNGEGGGC